MKYLIGTRVESGISPIPNMFEYESIPSQMTRPLKYGLETEFKTESRVLNTGTITTLQTLIWSKKVNENQTQDIDLHCRAKQFVFTTDLVLLINWKLHYKNPSRGFGELVLTSRLQYSVYSLTVLFRMAKCEQRAAVTCNLWLQIIFFCIQMVGILPWRPVMLLCKLMMGHSWTGHSWCHVTNEGKTPGCDLIICVSLAAS